MAAKGDLNNADDSECSYQSLHTMLTPIRSYAYRHGSESIKLLYSQA